MNRALELTVRGRTPDHVHNLPDAINLRLGYLSREIGSIDVESNEAQILVRWRLHGANQENMSFEISDCTLDRGDLQCAIIAKRGECCQFFVRNSIKGGNRLKREHSVIYRYRSASTWSEQPHNFLKPFQHSLYAVLAMSCLYNGQGKFFALLNPCLPRCYPNCADQGSDGSDRTDPRSDCGQQGGVLRTMKSKQHGAKLVDQDVEHQAAHHQPPFVCPVHRRSKLPKRNLNTFRRSAFTLAAGLDKPHGHAVDRVMLGANEACAGRAAS
ncbi:hypothetical protein DUPY_51000 [Duganella phyllosphaerae]|uniref:Uncharacterized protein n=1 Tax=Duganella phyllosphaerae TaxID=762836 RepID=A0A1E7W6C1_9BURK|nr:hypothetical protein DUPY_51000 [Duganella phyllosphaerae]